MKRPRDKLSIQTSFLRLLRIPRAYIHSMDTTFAIHLLYIRPFEEPMSPLKRGAFDGKIAG